MFNRLSIPKIQILKTGLGFLFSTIESTISKVKELKNWKKRICKHKGLSKEMLEIEVERLKLNRKQVCARRTGEVGAGTPSQPSALTFLMQQRRGGNK